MKLHYLCFASLFSLPVFANQITITPPALAPSSATVSTQYKVRNNGSKNKFQGFTQPAAVSIQTAIFITIISARCLLGRRSPVRG